MNINKIKRGINHFHTKVAAYFCQREYHSSQTRVKYMLFKEKTSDVLIVSFPACAQSPKYNYMRTLLPYKVNKLFLLDDFSDNQQGCYLIEKDVEQCTKALINRVISELRINKIVFIGSSKGGYSALNFSFLIPNVIVIIGSPQYFLGSYLDCNVYRSNYAFIVKDNEGKEWLDNRLRNRIQNSNVKPQCIYIHYSIIEHTYEEHVRALLCDLHNACIPIQEDVNEYPSHSDLSIYYPPFLVNTLNVLLRK